MCTFTSPARLFSKLPFYEKNAPKDTAHLYALLAFYAIIAFLPTSKPNEQGAVQKKEILYVS